jgi:FlaA1/EpsC-like NDP-sugar epimerase
MTIPEAAQLVIQAGAMAIGGDVFLLDMGEPVRIIDLAKRMIELSGFTMRDNDNPDGEIEIKIAGLRPGEKLYEELLIADNPIKTSHQRIFKAHENYIKFYQLRQYLDALEIMIADGNVSVDELRELIKNIVNGYHVNGFSSETKKMPIMSR